MPVVTIELWEGRTAEQKRKLIKEVTSAFENVLGTPKEHVTIIFHDVKKDNWGMNGEQASQVK